MVILDHCWPVSAEHWSALWVYCNFIISFLNFVFYKKTETLEKQAANTISWCPTGQFVVLAGLKRYIWLKCTFTIGINTCITLFRNSLHDETTCILYAPHLFNLTESTHYNMYMCMWHKHNIIIMYWYTYIVPIAI